MLEAMLSGEKWSLRPWKKTIDDQLNSWIMYVPGMKDSTENKELSAFKGIVYYSEAVIILLYFNCRFIRRPSGRFQ